MSRFPRTIVFPFLFLSVSLAVHAQSHVAGEFTIEPYVHKTFDGQDHKAELGKLWVRENRGHHSDRLIQLAFLRLKSTSAGPGAPIVFLSGGPGIPATILSRVPVYFRLMEKLREAGDVILLDQRGIGMSSPNLECPPGFVVPPDAFATTQRVQETLLAKERACAGFWRAKGVDLSAYNVQESADDLEDLRRALGAEQLSLLGHSYGTTLGLEAIRRHSDHLRRVVLASVEGPDQVMHLPEVWDFDLLKISRIIAGDPHWKGSMPDMAALLKQVCDRIDHSPIGVTVTDRTTGGKIPLKVAKLVIQFLVHDLLPNGRSVVGLPALVETLSRGEPSLLAPKVEDLYNGLRSGFTAMQFAMRCSQGWSEERRAQVQRQAAHAILGNAMNIGLTAGSCVAARSADLGGENISSIWSAVPTLFLSGTLDVNTPPFQAEEIRWGFPNGTHIVVENGFHETLPSPQVQAIIADFLKGEEVRGRAVKLDLPEFLTVEQAKAAQENRMPGRPR